MRKFKVMRSAHWQLPNLTCALPLLFLFGCGGWSATATAQKIVRKNISYIGQYSSFNQGPQGGRYRHKAVMYLPAGKGPFPLVVFAHGTPRKGIWKKRNDLKHYKPAAREFAKLGWASVLFRRRGYAGSRGQIFDRSGRCDNKSYEIAGLNTAKEIKQAVLALSKLPQIDGSRVIAAGVSTGGFGSLASAGEDIPGLQAVVNFVGTRSSRVKNKICQPDK